MKSLIILLLLTGVFSIHGHNIEAVIAGKLRNFMDEHPKIYVASEDCEIVVYEKVKSNGTEANFGSVTMRFGGKIPTRKDHHNKLYFYHGGAKFLFKPTQLFHFNLNRSHRYRVGGEIFVLMTMILVQISTEFHSFITVDNRHRLIRTPWDSHF